MKSDWHRYNLKRRVALLPAIDELTFVSKIAALSNTEDGNAENANKSSTRDLREKKKAVLEARKKELLASREVIKAKRTQTIYGPHKYLLLELSEEDASHLGIEESESEVKVVEESLISERLAQRVEIPITTCFFCPARTNTSFSSPLENVDHMFKKHGLYIPERKYLVDSDGLLTYLAEKVGLGNCCLACSYQGRNLEAVRDHMLRKRHMRIPYESQAEKLEISDYYDFTSTYDAYPEKAGVQYEAQNEEDWEDVSGDDSDGDVDADDEDLQEHGHYMESETSLHLASGAMIGHRLMAKYYRQTLKPERILSEGQGTVIAAETRHFIKPKNHLSAAQLKRIWLQEKKHEDRNDRHAAKYINNQPHFRDPLLQYF